MNAAEHFRLRFQALVARGLAAPEVAAKVGLAAASEVWGGDEPRHRPAWYLWLRGGKGAWQLDLADAAPLVEAGPSAIVATFVVRHYPRAGDADGFSAEERSAIEEVLDGTGTPRISRASSLRPELFAVATLQWAVAPPSEAAAFAVASLDRLRTRGSAAELVRDVAGWRLGVPILSAVVGLHAQLERQAATRVVLATSPGFELVRRGAETEVCDALDLVHAEALVSLAGERDAATAAALLAALRDPAARTVADVPVSAAAHVHSLAPGLRVDLGVSHAWFGGARHFERPACAC